MNVCGNDRENETDGGIDQSNCVEWVRNYRPFCECDDQSVIDGLVVVASGLVTTSKYSHTYASLMRGRFATRWVRFWVRFEKPLKNPLAVHAMPAGPSC